LSAIWYLLHTGISVNSKAHVRRDPETHVYTYVGNKTECSLLSLVDRDLGGNYGAVRERLTVAQQLPFSSDRKRMSTVVKLEKGDDHRLHCKGAPEMVLELCASILLNSGEIVELTDLHKNAILASVEQFSNDALRTIGIAYRDLPESAYLPPSAEDREKGKARADGMESDLTFVGLFGIEDPLRPDVRNAVQSCQGAGITVRMVTGDHSNTARSIAKQCGILTQGGIVMEGPVFRHLSHQEMASKLPHLQVLARSTPLDKQLLVERLQEMGEVVAVTGDGTNDAPALNKAHVGLAMGIEGTGVAKQASDIIILDDNFSSIVKSVLWGRNVRENVQKFLQFQLTVRSIRSTAYRHVHIHVDV
jgi:Ca2+-transporting ATPase